MKITRREFLKAGSAGAAVSASAMVLPSALAETPDAAGGVVQKSRI